MKQLRRTEWFEWRCDLPACLSLTATHKHLIAAGDEQALPPGWVTISPPRYWKGNDLAFCSQEHAERFVSQTVIIQPQLTAGPG